MSSTRPQGRRKRPPVAAPRAPEVVTEEPPLAPDDAAPVVKLANDAGKAEDVACRTTVEREAKLTQAADFAFKKARELAGGGKSDQNAAVKWFAEGTKAEGRAAELGSVRERRRRTKRLEALGAQLLATRRRNSGRGGTN